MSVVPLHLSTSSVYRLTYMYEDVSHECVDHYESMRTPEPEYKQAAQRAQAFAMVAAL